MKKDKLQKATKIVFFQLIGSAVVLCGYISEIYDASLSGWMRIDRAAFAASGRKRTESLWLNPTCVAGRKQPDLLEVVT